MIVSSARRPREAPSRDVPASSPLLTPSGDVPRGSHSALVLLLTLLLAIKHMLNMEQSTIRASILAFDCGAGKTLSLLGLVVTRVLELRTEYHEKKLFFNEDVGLFAPTLVVCPAASITVWEDEVNKCFPGVITVYKFYSTRTDSFKSSGSNTLPHTAEGLDEFLHELDPRDEKVRSPFSFCSGMANPS